MCWECHTGNVLDCQHNPGPKTCSTIGKYPPYCYTKFDKNGTSKWIQGCIYPKPQLIKTVQQTPTIPLWTAIATGTDAMALVGTPCQLISLPQFQTKLPPPNVQPSLQRPPAMRMNSWEKLTTLSYFSWVWQSTSTFSSKGIVNAVYSGWPQVNKNICDLPIIFEMHSWCKMRASYSQPSSLQYSSFLKEGGSNTGSSHFNEKFSFY